MRLIELTANILVWFCVLAVGIAVAHKIYITHHAQMVVAKQEGSK